MPSEPDHNMDKHLRTYARQRREDAGRPELHPAARRVLQSEVAKLRQHAGTRGGSLWELLSLRWPRLAFAAALFLALAVGIWGLLPDQNRASGPGLMSKHFEKPIDATVPFEMKTPSQKDKAVVEGPFQMADKQMTAEPTMDLEQRQNQTPALRGLAESATRNATDPLSLAESKADFGAFGGGAPALRAEIARSSRSKLAPDAGVNAPNLTSAGVAEPSAVTLNDSVAYSRAPAAGEQRLYVATGHGGAVTDGNARFFFSANNATNTRNEGLAWRSDGFVVSPAAGGNRRTGLLGDSALTSNITNNLSFDARRTIASRDPAAGAQSPVGPAAGATTAPFGTLGDLALNRPQTTAAPAPSAQAMEGRARLETEPTKPQSGPAARPERFFKETKPAPLESEREFLLAEITPPRPLGVDALTRSASPAPVTPLTTPAPSRPMVRGATAGRQPSPAPGSRDGGNNLSEPPKNESNAAAKYRFARLSVVDESLTRSKVALARTDPPVLEQFDFEQSATGVRLIDSDGSIYEGRLISEPAMAGENLAAIRARGQIQALAKDLRKPADAGKTLEQSGAQFAGADRAATNATFRVSGTNRTSGLLVTFTGSLVSGATPAKEQRKFAVAQDQAQRFRGGGAPAMDAGDSSRLLGRLRIGATNETDFLAAPAAR